MKFTIEIPDEYCQCFAEAYGWKATIPDPDNLTKTIPNPVTYEKFTENKLKFFWKDTVLARVSLDTGETERKKKYDEVKKILDDL